MPRTMTKAEYVLYVTEQMQSEALSGGQKVALGVAGAGAAGVAAHHLAKHGLHFGGGNGAAAAAQMHTAGQDAATHAQQHSDGGMGTGTKVAAGVATGIGLLTALHHAAKSGMLGSKAQQWHAQ